MAVQIASDHLSLVSANTQLHLTFQPAVWREIGRLENRETFNHLQFGPAKHLCVECFPASDVAIWPFIPPTLTGYQAHREMHVYKYSLVQNMGSSQWGAAHN